MAGDWEQAEIYFPNHDEQIPGAKLWGRGRGGTNLCGGESTGYRKPVYKTKDGSRHSGIQTEADESEPYQPEIPPWGQYRQALPTADSHSERENQRHDNGHSDCKGKLSTDRIVRCR